MVNITLPGFSNLSLVYQLGDIVLLKALRDIDQRKIILKTFLQDAPSLEDAALLTKEFSNLQNLAIDGSPKPLELAQLDKRPLMATEYFSGITLREYIRGKTLSPGEFLEIALQIVKILSDLHAKGFMHKDISPFHILIDTESREVQLIGFGKASQLSSEYTSAYQLVANQALHYLSPEQTGRMNRSIDRRTDLYSLGITFYELLAGELPFQSDDLLEIVHAHIAKKTPLLSDVRKDIPIAISKIIQKLTEKIAEARYQSAAGLLADLRKCQSYLLNGESIPDFDLAVEDVISTFRIPEKLYGREQEIALLMDAYSQVETGECQLMFINGYSGVGKTALVNEVHRPTAVNKGYFISGKFDQYKSNIPFHAFSIAFAQLSQYLLSEPEYRLTYIKKKLVSTLGVNSSVLIELIPEFELILGEQPASQNLKPSETESRFFFTLFEFVRVFAQKEHPLCIFIDDLQWCDDASLRLVKELVLQDIPYLFIIGSYRDNEVDEMHPLSLTMDSISKVKPYQILELEALKLSHVEALMVDTLLQEQDTVKQLSKLVHKLTIGNPFHLNELLKSLYRDELIHFDYDSGSWKWKINEISASNVSTQAVELMTRRLQELDDECLELLKIAACLGNEFDLKTLALLRNHTASYTAKLLLPAVQRELIMPISRGFLIVTENQDFGLKYKFYHDRIQQSAYQLIGDQERKKLHKNVGQVMLAHLSAFEQNEQLIDITRHLNEATELIDAAAEKRQLAGLNLKAGQKSQSAIAYRSALNYFEKGIGMLSNDAWTNRYDLAFDLYSGYAQCAYQLQLFDVAEQAIDLLISKAKTKLEKVKIISVRLRQYTTIGKTQEAVELGIDALKLLGYKLPMKPGKLTVLKEVLKAKWNLGKRKPKDILEGAVLKDPEKLAAARLMMEIGPSAYILGNSNLYGLTNLKVVNLSLKYGICPESCFAFVSFGAVQGDGFGNYKAQEEFGKLGIAIGEKLRDIEYKCRTLAAYGVLTFHLSNHWKDQLDFFKNGIAAGYASGDLFFLAYCANNAVAHHPNLPLLTNIEEQNKYHKISRQVGFQDAVDSSNLMLQFTRSMAGLNDDPLNMNSDGFSTDACMENMLRLKNYSGLGMAYIHKARLHIHAEKYEQAYAFAQKARKYKSAMFSLINLELLNIVTFFSCAGLYHGDHNPKSKLKSEMKKQYAQMKKWAKYNPTNFLHLQYLMEAVLHGVEGDKTAAALQYEKAIDTASNNKWLNAQAFAHEGAAKFYMKNGMHTAAKAHFREAIRLYEEWEAFQKIAFLTQHYPQYFDAKMTVAALLERKEKRAKQAQDNFQELDVVTLFKSHQAISGEIELKTLLNKMMQITMMNAGAENGKLFLRIGDKLVLQAQAQGDDIKTMQSLAVEGLSDLPHSVVNYVSRTQDTVVLENAAATGQFADDPYVREQQLKSIICQPIILLNKLYGILYLENNLSEGAFTSERLKMLSLLTSQMAISLQNALLYASLEDKVQERTTELRAEKKKSDELLHNILPEEVANELREKGYAKARFFENTTVLFTDFTNFTRISESLSPEELVQELNRYFTVFDQIAIQNGLERIKTIGDSFMAVSGIPLQNEDHAHSSIRAAFQMNVFVQDQLTQGGLFNMRVGLSSGPVVAGIVGVKKFAYDIWGDTVNMASRMETNCPPGKINISENTYQLVKDDFQCTHRGQVKAKNKGVVDMYLVEQ